MTHEDFINLWPSIGDFADDIGVSYNTAKAMKRRSSIPVEYFEIATKMAAERGIEGVSIEALVLSATPRKPHTPSRVSEAHVAEAAE